MALYPIPVSIVTASAVSTTSAALRFTCRCATDDVRGINRMLGERCSSHACATCVDVAPKIFATSSSADDYNGVNPPSEKNGTYAIPCAANASSPRLRRLSCTACLMIRLVTCGPE